MQVLHGKRLKMRLSSDPEYYYEGRFSVGPMESGASYSSISITYQLDTYKFTIQSQGSDPILWDTFNFETDYDYSVVFSEGITAGTYYIYANDYPIEPVATYVSGSGTISFGGVTQSMSSVGSKTLGKASTGRNSLVITGTLKVNIAWRGGLL